MEITTRLGAGGSEMQGLIHDYILKYLASNDSWKKRFNVEVSLEDLDDSSVVDNVVMTTDSHVVRPIFFAGGDIGRLSVSGTVNDISVIGAEPVALTFGLVLAEGFPVEDLEKILDSMGKTCSEAGVFVATGDTKVVERGSLDGLVINTSAIGRRTKYLDKNIKVVKKYREFDSRWLLDSNLREGDKIIVSGTIGDHGITILSAQKGYDFGTSSDVAPMNRVIQSILEVGGIVSMKDATRGGLANLLYEWAEKSGTGIIVNEEDIPIRESVKEAAEILGINPLQTGNEGKIVIGCVPQKAEEILARLKEFKEGKDAKIIGSAEKVFGNHVLLQKKNGGKIVLERPLGDPVPRVC
ncbi:MAG: hydrogenase expression/formation protein HypE [Patescibacteria group bacterium]|nr:hydrogenase expression/formation protein HypE [Patescibacteria group bacterium]